jgi:SAM-dependent methyltransferase
MFHREIGEAISDYLASYFGGKTISLMDLGCGDASQTLLATSKSQLAFYYGCDVSSVALGLAGKNIAKAGIPHELDNRNMLECAANPGRTFDVIFSSFAMHHLDLVQKAVFLKDIRSGLNPNGVLILVDLALAADEDRIAYLDHYLGYAETHWAEMSPNEIAAIRNHASSHDFPERLSVYQQLSMEAGLSQQAHLCQHTWHQVLVYKIA